MKGRLSSKKHTFHLIPTLIGLVLYAGFILSIISWMRVCSEGCTAIHDYRLFGVLFEPIGIAFFGIAGVLHAFSGALPIFSMIVGLMLGGAAGAEVMFILVQKLMIGQWCPVCLSIAATVFIAFGAVLFGYFQELRKDLKEHQRGKVMNSVWKGLSSLSVLILGFVIALIGIAKPEHSFADGIGEDQSPIFGNQASPIEVYVITDWFCSACRKTEGRLHHMYPSIMREARLIFVDLAIHPESMNYIPYNLSFMLNEKEKYFEIREALHRLALRSDAPSPTQVQAAVAPYGVKYRQLNYADVNSGIRYFEGIADTFDVDSTPTVVVANRRKIQARKLVGSGEITKANIMRLIEELSQ